MPKVSVIIPVYNVERYLRECLDSIINQTLEDIEIICINDGSTDNSLEILCEYEKKDNRIIVFNQENKGVSTARNNGIKLAKGEFVCFIDPDDKYPTQDVLAVLYHGAIKNNVLICGGEFSHFTNNADVLEKEYQDSFLGYLFEKNEIIEYKDYQFDYGYHRFVYDREFLLENEIFYPLYKRFQDPPFFVNAMIKAKRFYALDKITYAYRIGHNTVKWNTEKTNHMLMGILDNMKYAHEYNLSKLNEYSYIRLEQHLSYVRSYLNFRSYKIIKKMSKYNPKVKSFVYKQFIKKYIQNIFSVKNNTTKTHKIITILGLKIKIKRGKNNTKS